MQGHCDGDEGCAREGDAVKTPEVEFYQDVSGEWRWRVIAKNGEQVIPPESHPRNRAEAVKAFRTAKRTIAAAAIRKVAP